MKDDKVYLYSILESIEKIEEYTEKGRDEFLNKHLIQDAVIRNLEIIGEATKNIVWCYHCLFVVFIEPEVMP